MLKEVHIFFYGEVQGVGFRAAIYRIANHFGLKGSVCNRPNGSVQVIAQSDENTLKNFINEIQSLPAPIKISNLEIIEQKQPQYFANFTIS